MLPTGVAHRYARALVDAATADRDPRRIAAEVDGFAEIFGTSAELRTLLANPAVPREQKHAVIERLIERLGYTRTVRNFLFVLVDNRRTELLGAIRLAFRSLLDEKLGVVPVAVRTAHELNEAERGLLADALRRMTGREVQIEFKRDAELLGGVVARIGSTIYDGSLREQLRRIQERLSSE